MYTGQDKVEFGKVMAFLGASFPKFNLTQETIKAYDILLCDVPVDQVKKQAVKHARESRWFPSAAELRPSGAAAYAVAWRKRAAISARMTRQDYLDRMERQGLPKPDRVKSVGELVKV